MARRADFNDLDNVLDELSSFSFSGGRKDQGDETVQRQDQDFAPGQIEETPEAKTPDQDSARETREAEDNAGDTTSFADSESDSMPADAEAAGESSGETEEPPTAESETENTADSETGNTADNFPQDPWEDAETQRADMDTEPHLPAEAGDEAGDEAGAAVEEEGDDTSDGMEAFLDDEPVAIGDDIVFIEDVPMDESQPLEEQEASPAPAQPHQQAPVDIRTDFAHGPSMNVTVLDKEARHPARRHVREEETGREMKWKEWLKETLWIAIVATLVALAASEFVRWRNRSEPPPPNQEVETDSSPAAGPAASTTDIQGDWADSLEIPAEILTGLASGRVYRPRRPAEASWPGREGGQQAATISGNPVIARRVAGSSAMLYDLGLGNGQQSLTGTWAIPSECASKVRVTAEHASGRAEATEVSRGQGWTYALALSEASCQSMRSRIVARTTPSPETSEGLARAAQEAWPQGGFGPLDLRDVAIGKIGNTRHAWGVFRASLSTTQVLPPPPLNQMAFAARSEDGKWRMLWTFKSTSSSELVALAGVFDVLGDGVPQAFFAHRDRSDRHTLMRVAESGAGWAVAEKEDMQ